MIRYRYKATVKLSPIDNRTDFAEIDEYSGLVVGYDDEAAREKVSEFIQERHELWTLQSHTIGKISINLESYLRTTKIEVDLLRTKPPI